MTAALRQNCLHRWRERFVGALDDLRGAVAA
jgi:hypothetical protein